MGEIGHGYGSEWHLLRYLGYHREALNNYILSKTNGDKVEWLDFHFSSNAKTLCDDSEWIGVKPIEDSKVSACWQTYWPSTGSPPNWDAVGRLNKDDKQEWLFVEAKAHVKEMNSECGASSDKSKQMIREALEATAKVVTNNGVPTAAWYDTYYQFANRLAVLNFLLNICDPMIPSRLIFIYFCGERTENMEGRICPSCKAQWEDPHLEDMYKKLDINLQAALMQRVHPVYIPINPS